MADNVSVGVEDTVGVREPGADRVGEVLTVDVRLTEPEAVSERVPRALTDDEDVVLGDRVLVIEPVTEEVPVLVRVLEMDPVAVVV